MTPAARSFVLVVCTVLATAIIGAAGLGFMINTNDKSHEAKEQSEENFGLLEQVKGIAETNAKLAQDNATLLRIVLAVTGCTEADTPAQCHQRIVDAGVNEGVARIAEVDCRLRRALASLPPPPPNEKCSL